MDAVNAITKSAVPMTHPLLQLLLPHSGYQLPLDHAVLESAESVVNANAQGTRFDPLMSDGYDLKVLFGAGYAGLPEEDFGNAYPPYDYMNPQKGFDSKYGEFLQAYYEPFEAFCTVVASTSWPGREQLWDYAARWMHYNNAHVLELPGRRPAEGTRHPGQGHGDLHVGLLDIPCRRSRQLHLVRDLQGTLSSHPHPPTPRGWRACGTGGQDRDG